MLKKENIQDIYPLSSMQEGIYYHALRTKNSPTYFIQNCYRIHANFDVDKIHQSLDMLIERYDVLRTVFTNKNKKRLLQIVLKERESDFFYCDLRGVNLKSQKHQINEYLRNDKGRGFDLSSDILMRLAVFQLNENEYEFVWSHHHILMDGWCSGIITSEFMMIYESLLANREIHLPTPVPYSKYIQWFQNQNLEASEQYWSDYSKGFLIPTGIPENKFGAILDESKGEYMYALTKDQSHQLQLIAKQNYTTLYIVFQTLWSILLSKYNNTCDVLFGSVVSGRSVPLVGVEKMVGLFLNTLPVRVYVDGEKSFLELLKDTSSKDNEGKSHHHFPLAKIQLNSELRDRLFNHILIFENYPTAITNTKNTEASPDQKKIILNLKSSNSFQQTNYDLDVGIIPGQKTLLKIGFSPFRYSLERVQEVTKHFSYLVDQIIENNENKINSLLLIEPDEISELEQISKGNVSNNDQIHILETFNKICQTHSDSVALVYKDVHLTYSFIENFSDQLAQYFIKSQELKEGDRVGVLSDYSEKIIISILAIMKAGAIYLPLEDSLPESRLKEIMEDANVNLLVTDSKKILSCTSFYHGKYLALDLQLPDRYHEKLCIKHCFQSPAYIIYTSGSTGKPKGIVVNYEGMANLVESQVKSFMITNEDVILQFSSILFDASISEIFTALATGAKLVLADKETILNPNLSSEYIKRYGITLATFPPSVIKNIGIDNLASMKKVVIAGEKVVFEEGITFNQLTIYNAYGPAEGTVCSTINKIDPGLILKGNVPIGRPIDNVDVLILDKDGNMLPKGIEGEICVAGKGVSMGYLNRPELTNKSFTKWKNHIIYRTGDMGKWLPSDQILFSGRKDQQIKIRGQRVELDDIRQNLLQNEDITNAILVLAENKLEEKSIVVFYTANFNLEASSVKSSLQKKLASFMVPEHYVQLPELPLTMNGKLDRRRLENEADDLVNKRSNCYLPPKTETELKLAEIWKEILVKDQIGKKDDFFLNGGHSLSAVFLVAQIYEVFNLKFELQTLFDHPTIEELAEEIDSIGCNPTGIKKGQARKIVI